MPYPVRYESKTIQTGKMTISPADVIRMIALHCDGATHKTIADTFGVSANTVYKVFARDDFERIKERILYRIADNCADRMSGVGDALPVGETGAQCQYNRSGRLKCLQRFENPTRTIPSQITEKKKGRQVKNPHSPFLLFS